MFLYLSMDDRLVLRTYIGFIILSLTPIVVSGCRCFPTHPQKIFCSRDFVFVGKVLKETFIPGKQPDPNNNDATYEYQFRVIYNMKGNIGAVGTTITLTTAGNGALCGVRLTIGSKLLITVHKNKHIGLCDLVIETSSLTFEQMVYFFSNGRNSYRRNCQCQEIVENDSKTFSDRTGCKLPADSNEKDCYFKTALCKRVRGSCKWTNDDCK